NRADGRRYAEEHSPSAEVLALLVDRSEGNFLYLRNALDALRGEANPAAVLRRLPRGLHDAYPIFFQRRFPDEASYKRARRLLQVMVAAREPLTESQLSTATGLNEETVLPR